MGVDTQHLLLNSGTLFGCHPGVGLLCSVLGTGLSVDENGYSGQCLSTLQAPPLYGPMGSDTEVRIVYQLPVRMAL